MSSRLPALLALAAVSTASTCDSNVGEGDSRGRETVRMSQRADGGQASGDSVNAGISADGRYVVFESDAEDLVVPDGNGWRDIFLKDRTTGRLENVTRVDPSIFFVSIPLTNLLEDASNASVSADGRYVAFLSKGLFAGPSSFPPSIVGTVNVFVKDRRTGTVRSAVNPTTFGWPNRDCSSLTMSDDGRFVAFISASSNLGYANPGFIPQVYVADLGVSPVAITLVSRSTASAATVANGACSEARLSRDGSVVTFLSPAANLGAAGNNHVFLGTPAGAVPEMITVMPGTSTPAVGTYLYPAVSGDGRYVIFYASGPLLPSVGEALVRVDRGVTPPAAIEFARDMWVQSFPALSGTGMPFSVSNDGTIAYMSRGPLERILVRSSPAGSEIVSYSSLDVLADLASFRPVISGDGRWVAWDSASNHLVEGDTNLKGDVFVRGPLR